MKRNVGLLAFLASLILILGHTDPVKAQTETVKRVMDCFQNDNLTQDFSCVRAVAGDLYTSLAALTQHFMSSAQTTVENWIQTTQDTQEPGN